jgi:hypothetical protein
LVILLLRTSYLPLHSLQVARQLQGASPVNKAQVERIENNLKAGVLPFQ